MTNVEDLRTAFMDSGLVIVSSFVLRHSCFVISFIRRAM
jgi:hypothetical protein